MATEEQKESFDVASIALFASIVLGWGAGYLVGEGAYLIGALLLYAAGIIAGLAAPTGVRSLVR